MTATDEILESIREVISQCGGKECTFHARPELGVCCVRFIDREGRRNARYGTSWCDLHKRCEKFLEKQT